MIVIAGCPDNLKMKAVVILVLLGSALADDGEVSWPHCAFAIPVSGSTYLYVLIQLLKLPD
jgi:hypothetical protein